jgi:hypothetical protein
VFLDPDPSVYTGFWDIAAGPGGEVYGVGFVIEGDDPAYEVVLRSLDRGDTWETASVATYVGDTQGRRRSLAVGPSGEVYDVGIATVALPKKQTESRWTTWRLAPGSSTVEIVDQFAVSSAAYNVAVDGLGRDYVHGGRSGFDGSMVRASASGNSGTWDD